MEIDPQRTAVLALHWQHDIVTHDGAFGPFFAAMVESSGVVDRTAQVLEASRATGVRVIYARVCFASDHRDVIANSPLFAQVLETRALVRGSRGAEVIAELAPHSGDLVVDHVRASPFVGTGLFDQLAEAGIDTILLTGVATNVVVEATGREAANAGLDVVVLADCCTAADEAAHEASLATLGLLTRGVVTADEYLAALTRASLPTGSR